MSGDIAPKIGRGYARNLDAGPFQPMIGSFDLHLRAEKKSPKDDPHLRRGRAVVRRRVPYPRWPVRLVRGEGAARPGVDGYPPGPVLRRLRQQPVPGADVTAGRVPSIRAISVRLHVGQSRAYLATLTGG